MKLDFLQVLSEMNQYEYFQLLEIGETEDFSLRLVLAEAIVTEQTTPVTKNDEPNDAVRNLLNSSRPIEITDSCAIHEIIFEDYIAYSVVNESFTTGNHYDEFEGECVRIYRKSHFLNYVSEATFATKEFPGPFEHYGFCCGDHIVDVVSVAAPNVAKLEDNMPPE